MRARSRFLAAATLAAAMLPLGCKSVRARDWNLRSLHDVESGRHRLVAAQVSDFEYILKSSQLFGGNGLVRLAESNAAEVENPPERCLELLLGLTDFDSRDLLTSSLQVEWLAFVAAADPWKLSRERAALELGGHGRRLGARQLIALTEEDGAIGPGELLASLRSLIDALEPIVAKRSGSAATALDVAAACEVMRERPLDLDGARRALRATAALASAASRDRPELEPLVELVEYLQRSCVEQALAAALNDDQAIVRAAAIAGAVAAIGPDVLPDFLQQVNMQEENVVLLSLLGQIERYGLPEVPEGIPADQRESQRLQWLGSLWRYARHPEGSVRVAAMQALSSATGGAVQSLREEDWQAWWIAELDESRRDPGPPPEDAP